MKKHLEYTLFKLLFLLSLSFSLMAENQQKSQYEDYNSSQKWTEPRLQYTRFSETGEMKIWSSKTDGSDEQLVFAFGNFDEKKGYMTAHRPVRSPNNRYLMVALVQKKPNEFISYIVDLKKQTYELVEPYTGTGYPMYNWSQDNKTVYYKAYHDIKAYNVDTGEYTDLDDIIYSLRDIIEDKIYLLKDQKTFLSIVLFDLITYDSKTGKEVKDRINLEKILKWPATGPRQITDTDLSPDQKHLYFKNTYGTGVISIETGKLLYYILDKDQPEEGYMREAIFINNSELIYEYKKALYVLDIFTQKRTKIPGSHFEGHSITLINKRNVK